MILKLDLPATGQSEGIAELYGRLQQTDKPPNEMLMVTADIKKSHISPFVSVLDRNESFGKVLRKMHYHNQFLWNFFSSCKNKDISSIIPSLGKHESIT